MRLAYPKRYREEREVIDVYQMDNVDKYLTCMVIGKPNEDALWRKHLRLIQSQQYPTSAADEADTLFAISYAFTTRLG